MPEARVRTLDEHVVRLHEIGLNRGVGKPARAPRTLARSSLTARRGRENSDDDTVRARQAAERCRVH